MNISGEEEKTAVQKDIKRRAEIIVKIHRKIKAMFEM